MLKISIQFTPRLAGEPFAFVERSRSSRWTTTLVRFAAFILFVEWRRGRA